MINVDTGVSAIANLATTTINTAINRIWPDKAEQEKQQLANDFALLNAQIEVNKIEAASNNRYASSWRPTIGYICAAGIAYNFIVYPFLIWAAAIYAPNMAVPSLASDGLMELIIGMLGLGGMRSYEKIKGVSR